VVHLRCPPGLLRLHLFFPLPLLVLLLSLSLFRVLLFPCHELLPLLFLLLIVLDFFQRLYVLLT
jgi:hypothetical protein